MIAGALGPLVVGTLLLATLGLPVAAADRDGDGLRDAFETRYGVTAPDQADSDGDGVIDAAEDSDGDGLGNRGEQRFETDPTTPDSDGDGVSDSAEDDDGDGRSNALEQDQRSIPADVRPSLATADGDRQPSRPKCQTWHGKSKVTTCGFGDPEGEVEIVLAGDSHATMYLTPLIAIVEERGWHLTTMTKSACPALLGLAGNNQWEIDKGRTCRLWQERVVSRLNRAPVDLVIYAHTPGYKLRKPGGKAVAPWKRVGQWRRALKATTAALPEETTVLALGGTPRNFRGNPVRCLRRNPADISACVTRRQPEAARSMDVGLQQAASVSRARYDTLFEQICSYDPCPVIQGDVLMWRDGSHLSETFASQLKPSIERILTDALGLTTKEA